jgi:hypothetical protein
LPSFFASCANAMLVAIAQATVIVSQPSFIDASMK